MLVIVYSVPILLHPTLLPGLTLALVFALSSTRSILKVPSRDDLSGLVSGTNPHQSQR
jgi:hypothetical protein